MQEKLHLFKHLQHILGESIAIDVSTKIHSLKQEVIFLWFKIFPHWTLNDFNLTLCQYISGCCASYKIFKKLFSPNTVKISNVFLFQNLSQHAMCNTQQYLYQQLSVKNIKPDGRRISKQKLSPPFAKCIWGLGAPGRYGRRQRYPGFQRNKTNQHTYVNSQFFINNDQKKKHF